MENKRKAFLELFYKNAGYIAVLLVSLIYIAGSLILISKTGKSVYEIIASGVLSMVVGVLITGIFRSIGIQRGEADDRTAATDKLHSDTINAIIPYVDLLDDFCDKENKRAFKSIRTRILAKEGLKYDEYFDENGVSKPFKEEKIDEKSYKKKLKAYKRAVNLKIKTLTSSNLTAEGVNADNPFDFGRTKKQYTAQGNTSDIVMRVAMAVIFGYFGVAFATEINFGAIIWNALQVIMYICSGVMQMNNSYIWVINDYRNNKIRKIDLLDKFKIYATNERKKEVPVGDSSNILNKEEEEA